MIDFPVKVQMWGKDELKCSRKRKSRSTFRKIKEKERRKGRSWTTLCEMSAQEMLPFLSFNVHCKKTWRHQALVLFTKTHILFLSLRPGTNSWKVLLATLKTTSEDACWGPIRTGPSMKSAEHSVLHVITSGNRNSSILFSWFTYYE